MSATKFKRFTADVAEKYELDAGESIFFSTELTTVRSKAYEKKYPALKGRMLFPSGAYETHPGDEDYAFDMWDQVGIAKLLASYSDQVPRADIKATRSTVHIRGMASSYGYNMQEARAAAKARKPLQQGRANAAKRAVDQLMDSIIQVGDASHGLLGALNQPNATTYTVPNGAGGAATWADKTPDEIVEDIGAARQQVVDDTNGVEDVDTLLVPISQHGILVRRRMGDGSDKTILQYIKEAFGPSGAGWLKNVEAWYALAGAGDGETDRMMLYRRDEDYIYCVVPQEFEQLPPQLEGFETKVLCHARTAGIVCPYPLAVVYGDGI